MPWKWKQQLETWDRQIKEGKGFQVKQSLRDLNFKKVPRSFAAPIAKICYRVGLADSSLKILNPYLRSEKELDEPATEFERLQYGSALILLGAIVEGQSLIRSVNAENYPEATFMEALGHFSSWNYEEALPLLKSYIKAPQLTEYEQMIGRLNLAAALTFCSHLEESESELKTLLSWASEKKMTLLEGFACENLAQVYIHQNKYDLALNSLEKAQQALAKGSSFGLLFVRKWAWILDLFQASQNSMKELVLNGSTALKDSAMKLQQWETLRDVDFWASYFNGDELLRNKVYYGTPYTKYRQKMFSYFSNCNIAPSYLRRGERFDDKFHVLDIKNNTLDTQKNNFKDGMLVFRLLQLLLQDFYKPVRIVEIFESIYPDEFYDPFSSPHRVQQLINRLRSEIAQVGMDLEILNLAGAYKVRIGSSLGVKYRQGTVPLDRCATLLQQLKDNYKNKTFTSQEASQVLHISPRQTRNWLNLGIERNMVSKSKKGRITFYKVAS